jgi:hypothetical protein
MRKLKRPAEPSDYTDIAMKFKDDYPAGSTGRETQRWDNFRNECPLAYKAALEILADNQKCHAHIARAK